MKWLKVAYNMDQLRYIGMTFIVTAVFVFPLNQPIDKELLALLTPVAFCHALGHVMSNVSFAAVAVSFTHTIKGIGVGNFLGLFYAKWFCY